MQITLQEWNHILWVTSGKLHRRTGIAPFRSLSLHWNRQWCCTTVSACVWDQGQGHSPSNWNKTVSSVFHILIEPLLHTVKFIKPKETRRSSDNSHCISGMFMLYSLSVVLFLNFLIGQFMQAQQLLICCCKMLWFAKSHWKGFGFTSVAWWESGLLCVSWVRADISRGFWEACCYATSLLGSSSEYKELQWSLKEGRLWPKNPFIITYLQETRQEDWSAQRTPCS